MRKQRIVYLLLLLAATFFVQAQKDCKISFDEIDPFDSLHTVGSETIALGYLIPSKFETANGPKIIEEAEVIVLFTENDSISGFFMNLILPEYSIQSISSGVNVKFLLADTTVIGLYNYPDEGVFDRTINMRVYQHTCALPLDYFYLLAYHKVIQIRIEYDGQNKTLKLNEEQQSAFRNAIQCLGLAVHLYPIRT